MKDILNYWVRNWAYNSLQIVLLRFLLTPVSLDLHDLIISRNKFIEITRFVRSSGIRHWSDCKTRLISTSNIV